MAKTYNTFTNVSTGDVYTAASHNAILQNLAGYRVPPMCILAKQISLSNAGVTWDFPLIGDEELDTDDMHSIVTNTTRVTPSTPGVYIVTATTNAQGNYSMSLAIQKNATSLSVQANDNSTYFTSVALSTMVAMNGTTDYITVLGYSTTTATYQCRLTVAWLGQVS